MIAVCLFRLPETWLVSLHRLPWQAQKSLRGLPISEFVRRGWHCVIDNPGFGVRRRDRR